MSLAKYLGSFPFRRLFAPFAIAWVHRELIQFIVRRELAQRFRGAALGWIWALAGPLVMLGAYTIIFSGPLKLSSAAQGSPVSFALFLFVALIIFNLFAELLSRAPNLLRDNLWFVKRTIFPSDILAWIALVRALFYAGISFAMLLVFHLALTGTLHATTLLVIAIMIPFSLLLLGFTWFFAALGALTQDVSHVITTIMPVLIFACPVFYSLADAPEATRSLLYINPVTSYIEMMRDVVLNGALPSLKVYVWSWVAALIVFWGGHAVFNRYRSILVDVV